MNDIVTTTGRRMTRNLQEALDDLTGSSRSIVMQVLSERAAQGGTVSKLFRALVLELQLCDLRDDDLMRHVAREHQAGIDEPPLPPATGEPWYPDAG